jgi:hypothetical protein
MTDHSGKLAIWGSIAIIIYLISPPLVYKTAKASGYPMSDKVFSTLYAPLFPLVENVKPYAWLIETEAEYLKLD